MDCGAGEGSKVPLVMNSYLLELQGDGTCPGLAHGEKDGTVRVSGMHLHSAVGSEDGSPPSLVSTGALLLTLLTSSSWLNLLIYASPRAPR